MDTPLISVIVPFYNEEKFISQAIDSLLGQTYHNIEVILVNDHSTDGSREICLNVKDKRVKYFEKMHLPRGEAFSRNFGIEKATGQLITFLDADDTCEPDRIEKQLEKLKQEGMNSTICGCWVQKQGLQNTLMKLPIENEEIIRGFKRQYKRDTIVGATILGSRKLFQQFPYRTKFKYFTDWDLLLRMFESKSIKFVNTGEPLYHYIIRKKGTKFQSDWLDYNVFLRDCQYRRRKDLTEFESPEQMFKTIRIKEPHRYLFYLAFQNIIQLKRILKL